MFALGNATFACDVHSARERSFEEAGGETEVGRRLLANRTPTRSSDLCGRYFAWNWTIPDVILATVAATTATLSSNSCKSASFFKRILLPFYGNSSPRTIPFLGKRNLQSIARVKKLATGVMMTSSIGQQNL